ncbi:hypothetical protein BC941DRAFT_427668 [Chlamydoabsidia padenii]|nr:hypothetical protein BC941DRAFT_427668 [Chlamydoabsidia padenii]
MAPSYPYDNDSSDSDDGGWRDPSIVGGGNDSSPRSRGQGLGGQNESPDRQPDDCWLLPPNSTEVEVLGIRCTRLEEIHKKTNAYMVFNSNKHQVDIWGDRNCINHAKQMLDIIGDKINERKHPVRRTKKWEKPERELTDSERRRDEKKQQRILEGKSYQGLPTSTQPYSAFFAMPDDLIPLVKITGEKDAYLNQIRASCKSHVWYEPELNAFKVAGQDEQLVWETTARLRNLYLRLRRSLTPPKSAVLRLLYQPTENMGARFRALPSDFICCELYPTEQMNAYRMLEPIKDGVIPKASRMQQPLNLIEFNNDNDNTPATDQPKPSTGISGRLLNLNADNAQKMETALDEGLESLRLLDWEISMDVIFGQLYLLDYPNRERTYTFSSEDLAYVFFPNSRFNSRLSPCIGTTFEHVRGLQEYLSQHAEEYTDSPRTSYVINALQNPTLPGRPQEGAYLRGREASAAIAAAEAAAAAVTWKSVLTVNKFTMDGHVGLWNCVTDCNTLVSMSCANLEGEYSWETRLNYARRLPSDLNTPQGQFVDHLRLSNDKRLVVSLTPGYKPHIVKQLTKWIYAWEQYTVELEKEEMWDLANMEESEQQQNTGLPLDLSSHAPHSVKYHVSMVRESWRNRFADNVHLEIGQAPTWTARDFLCGQESTAALQDDAKKFADLLTSVVVPVYYNASTL